MSSNALCDALTRYRVSGLATQQRPHRRVYAPSPKTMSAGAGLSVSVPLPQRSRDDWADVHARRDLATVATAAESEESARVDDQDGGAA